jgi:hypothetical protein
MDAEETEIKENEPPHGAAQTLANSGAPTPEKPWIHPSRDQGAGERSIPMWQAVRLD